MGNLDSVKERLATELPALLYSLEPNSTMRNFKRNRYESFMEKYKEEHKAAYEDLELVYESGEDLRSVLGETMEAMAKEGKKRVNEVFFLKREREQMDLNCLIAFFVLPGILGGAKAEHKEQAEKTAKLFSAIWKESFPKTDIGVAPQEEIASGFKRKIFGIPVE